MAKLRHIWESIRDTYETHQKMAGAAPEETRMETPEETRGEQVETPEEASEETGEASEEMMEVPDQPPVVETPETMAALAEEMDRAEEFWKASEETRLSKEEILEAMRET